MQTLVFMIKMCSSRKYPYLPHGRNFFLKTPPPLPLWKYLWKFQFKLDTFLYIFFNFLALQNPSYPQEIPILSVGGVWIFSGTAQKIE